MAGIFFGGTSGLQIAMPKRDFPPEHADRSRLGFYGLQENSLEINSSFYRLPQAKTIAKWCDEVPAGFRFTFKLWKEITHRKNLLFQADRLQAFMQAISAAHAKKGAILLQFPPSLEVNALTQLRELLHALSDYDWLLAVEFRHPSWYADPVYELLEEYQAALVLQDMPRAATPMIITSDDLIYLRFHGPQGNYKGSYSDDFLYEYALYIKEWLDEGKTVYAYFNNTAGSALANLHHLKQCLSRC